MTTYRAHSRRFWLLYLLAFAAAATLAGAKHFVEPAKFDWPAWVQAVGSIAAILVAVWVSSDQALQQRIHAEIQERAEVNGVIRSLRSEIETTLRYIDIEVVPFLAVPSEGANLPIRVRFALPEYAFPIFDALIPKLATLPNAQLQRQIIHSYATAKALVLTAQHHNKLFDDLNRAEDQVRQANSLSAGMNVNRCGLSLVAYGQAMRNEVSRAQDELRKLIVALVRECQER